MLSKQLVTVSKPDYNVIPVQLSVEEFEKIYLAAPVFAQAGTAVQDRLSQTFQLHSQSALHWDAVERTAD
jgi:hypothetical protein